MLATACLVPTFAQAPPAEYGIRFDSPEPGSMIRRQAVRGSVLPINRTYAQLTAEERAILHGWYENIPPGDEPPFPAEGLKPVFEAFRQGQAKFPATGEMFLIATVEADGKVSEVKVIGSPSPEMVKFAASVLILTRFKPGVCGGQPCRMEFPLRQYFGISR